MSKYKESMKAFLPYALNQDGDLVHIDSVPNGKECRCICPHCKEPLLAKNGGTGEKMIHHFAHMSGADCVGARESALHIMAKDVMKETLCIQLPDRWDGRKGELLKLDRVEIEFFDKGTRLRPDCIGYYGDKVIWIEFKRTHAVDTKKRGKIISAKVDCVELDINCCTLEPEVVRKFITEGHNNRIWIRDTEANMSRSSSETRHASDYDDDMSRRIYALDERGALVNLQDDEFDMNTHSYYCVACGKELAVGVDELGAYEFVHIDENVHCGNDLYLHEAAKQILRWRFNFQKDFMLLVNQNLKCELRNRCTQFSEDLCYREKPVSYNLKEFGYTECLVGHKLPNYKYKCDVVIKKESGYDDAIIISIDAGDCHVDVITDEYRLIEIRIVDTNDLLRLEKEPIGKYNTYINDKFKRGATKTIPRFEVDRKFWKFSSFSSGKYYAENVPCSKLEQHANTITMEYWFIEGIHSINDAKWYSLLKCIDEERKICKCEICFFLFKRSTFYRGLRSICRRYKTKGTPKFPLQEMPIDCPYFCIDKDIESMAELNYTNVKVEVKEYST